MTYQVKEWESPSGWHFNCTDALGTVYSQWYYPARILGMSPADYIKYIIDNYKPEKISWCKDKCLVFFSWENYSNMHKLVLLINREARKKGVQI